MRRVLRDTGLGGTEVQPLLAGVNRFQSIEWLSLIFSAKMQPKEKRALRLFDLAPSAVREAREFDAVGQFMLRGSLRDPASTERAHLVVYDREQATWLGEFLKQHGFADPVELVHEQIGVVGAVARSALAPVDAAEAKVRKRQRSAERQRRRRARLSAAAEGD